MAKKALIVTYYWPPSGGSGVQRWLKFSKYLPEYDWEPIVYTPSNPEVSATDASLLKDVPTGITVLKRKAFEPYKFFRLLTGRKANMGVGFASADGKKQGLFSKLSLWLRANYFIPDARMFWIKPSVRFLAKYLKDNPVNIVITTGPPHSMHLVGLGLKQRLGVKWVADFRDPWTNIDFFNDLPLTASAKKKHGKLERMVVQQADAVVVISAQMKREFEVFREHGIEVITNGYDEEDFVNKEVELDNLFSITHIGSIPPNRNCKAFWKAIKSLTDGNKEFASKLKINLIGSVDSSVVADVDLNGLTEYCEAQGYIEHSQSVKIMMSSQVLLLLVNQSPNAEGILTGKVYEYLAANRPILAIGPKDGDLDALLTKTNAGVLADFTSEDDIREKLLWFFDQYQQGFPSFKQSDTNSYSRRALAEQYSKFINTLAIQ